MTSRWFNAFFKLADASVVSRKKLDHVHAAGTRDFSRVFSGENERD
jgi:hypothetical protein